MKPIRTILQFVLLGAIVNVAVAWGSAVWIDGFPHAQVDSFIRGVSDQRVPRWNVVIAKGRSFTVISHTAQRYEEPPEPPMDDAPEAIAAWRESLRAYEAGEPLPPRDDVRADDLPHWSRASTPPGERHFDTSSVRRLFLEDARGWPMQTLISHMDQEIDRSTNVRTAVQPDWRLDFGDTQGALGLARGLPLRPLPLGFAVNTLLYAVIAGILMDGMPRMRRHWRRRCGQCPACGYDLRGADHDACPECGTGAVMTS